MTISPDLVTGALSLIITLFIFSYLIGDNVLFRVATYIFVGVSAGFIAGVAWWQVLWPKLIQPLIFGSIIDQALLALPLLGTALILVKISPRLAKMGSPAMAYLVGAGAAVAIGGALTGTLLPQMAATINAFDIQAATIRNMNLLTVMFNGAVILLGTVSSLAYFHFGAYVRPDGTVRRILPIELLAWIGRVFIAITLGVIFAGVYAAALTALIERISSIIYFIGTLQLP